MSAAEASQRGREFSGGQVHCRRVAARPMDDFFRELRSFLHTVSARLSALLLVRQPSSLVAEFLSSLLLNCFVFWQESPRTVQLTSVLGLAAVLYGIYQLQGQGMTLLGAWARIRATEA